MIETSQVLQDTMRKAQTVSARLNVLKGTDLESYGFTYSGVDSQLSNNNYIENSESEGYYKIRQLNDVIFNETGNYGIFEGNGINLSGFNVIGQNAKNNEYGWYGNELSGANGVFTNTQSLNWSLRNYEDDSLEIIFSNIRNEYAKSFKVRIEQYDTPEQEEPTVYEYTETNNTNKKYTIQNIPKSNDTMITVYIYSWSKENARAKILDIHFGKSLTLLDEDISDINVTKHVSLENESIESKTLSFKIADAENELNIFEATGKFLIISKNARISIELGGTLDKFIYYTKIDEFLINDVTKESNTIEATVECYGRLFQYNDLDFDNQHYTKTSANDLLVSASEIFTHRIVDNEIKTENEQIRTEYGECKWIEGLNKIATAVRGNVIETIGNDVLVKRIKLSNPISTLTQENFINGNPEITKKELPKLLLINKYTPTLQGIETVFEQELVLNTESYNVFYYNTEHTAPPYTAKRYFQYEGHEDEVDITSTVYFTERKAYWQPVDGSISRYEITANKVELASTSLTYDIDINATNEITIDNQSIETNINSIANWLISNYNKRYEYNVEIQDIFTYELGDTVEIETGIISNGAMIIKQAIITGIEYKYNGSLHYNLMLRSA